jgi:hypothetical protein
MKRAILSFFAIFNVIVLLGQENIVFDRIADTIDIQGFSLLTSRLPANLVLNSQVGLVTVPAINGQLIFKSDAANKQYLYETRATITPKGDYLLMFPLGEHYGSSIKKVNNMMAFRSKDKGKTWQGPTLAYDIDYNQHGFIPLIPKGSDRIYNFGTQPIPYAYTRENGLQENAPIGFRYSDDDGYTWSEVKLISPVNDPGFRGMSVMRMCETDRGTWILGSHEGDWSYSPLITRQYILRSEDQGKTWQLLPDKRHKGWFVPCFGRMDEGRPINLGNDKVFIMLRTPEGHLWGSWSNDDGKTWSKPIATSLIHPDAPPMLFMLSDGKTLIALHHNKAINNDANLGGNPKIHLNRSEIWFATSTDGGHSWSEPRFLFVNALAPAFNNPFRDYNCSYDDAFTDNGVLHIFLPHRWQRVLHLTIAEKDLSKCPTEKELGLTDRIKK